MPIQWLFQYCLSNAVNREFSVCGPLDVISKMYIKYVIKCESYLFKERKMLKKKKKERKEKKTKEARVVQSSYSRRTRTGGPQFFSLTW